MQFNVWGWHNIPIATVLIKLIDGRFVKFLYCCYSARRFDQIVSDLYKRRIALKPLFPALIWCIVCPSSTTTRGAIPSRQCPCRFLMLMYVIFDRPGQLCFDIVGYTSRTAVIGGCSKSPGHGDLLHPIDLTSPHCPTTIERHNRIVTSARPRAITYCGDHSAR